MDKRTVFKISEAEIQKRKKRFFVVVWIAFPIICFGLLTMQQLLDKDWKLTLVMGAVFLGLTIFMGILFSWLNKKSDSQEITVTDDALEWSNQGTLSRYQSTDVVSVATKYSKTGDVAQLLVGTNKGNLVLERFEGMPELQSKILALVPHIEPIVIKEEKSVPRSIMTVIALVGMFVIFYVAIVKGKSYGFSADQVGALIKNLIPIGLGLYLLIVRPTGKRLGPTFGRLEPWIGGIMAIGGVVQLIRVFSG